MELSIDWHLEVELNLIISLLLLTCVRKHGTLDIFRRKGIELKLSSSADAPKVARSIRENNAFFGSSNLDKALRAAV